jgi:actin-related protein
MAGKKDSDKLIADQAKEIANLKSQLKSKQDAAEADSAKTLDIAEKLTANAAEELQIAQKLLEINKEKKDISKELSKARAEQNKDAEKEWMAYRRSENAQARMLKARQSMLKDEKAMLLSQEKHNELLKERKKLGEKYSDSFSKNLGIIDSIDDKIKEIPIVGDFLSKAMGIDGLKEKLVEKFEDGWESTKKGAEETKDAVEEMPGGVDQATKATKGFGAGMGAVLGIAMAIGAVVALFKAGLELDQEVTDLAKGLGVSHHEAHEIHHEMLNIAATTKVVGANAHALHEAYMQLSEVTGQSVINNTKMLETQVLLTKQYGMAGDEAAAFQTMSAGTGKTTEQQLGTIQKMTEEYNTMTGDSMNFKAITKDIAKVSKATLASYKGDVKALTLAAIQAKKIGMSLDDAASVSEKLLDVESSIEAEMKANVLAGKHMNMNKARQLAFDGDIAGAAAEAVKQAGSYDELMKMRPMQQKAIAEAAGMTVDQLMKAGEMQKMSIALGGKEIKDLADLNEQDRQRLVASGDISAEKANELAIQEQQASVQERLAQTLDGIKATFISIIDGPLGSIMEAFGSIVGNAHIMKGIIVAAAIAAVPFAISMAGAAISAISAMSAMTLGVGAIAIAGGIAVAAASMASERGKAEKVDDAMIDPDGGLVVKGKKGTFQLNEGDSIVAGTELGKSSDGGAGGEGGANGNQLASIKQLAKDVKGVNWKDLLELEFKFMMIGDAFEELDVDQITKFSELADKDLKGAGEKLAAGVNGLIGFDKNVSWMSLWSLEESFDSIEDVFAELDVDALTQFASLADADMALAGENLANGVNGLIGWDKNVKWSDLWSLEESFDLIEDVFDELDTEALSQFGTLADKDLGALGESLGAMFNTFAEFGTDETLKALDTAEDVFDYLEDALDELDYEQLGEFTNADFSKMEENAKHLFAGINELSKLSSLDLYGLENTFDLLEDAMDELDMDDLAEFLELDTAKLANIVNSALNGSGSGGSAEGKDPNAKIVSLLEQLIAKVDQPVNIKLGSRTIEEIGTQIGLRKSYSSRVDSGYGNV